MAGNILEITDSSFEAEIAQNKGVALVDFWAPWCGPCKALAPVIEELAGEYAGKAKVCKVNTDDNMQIAQKFRITGIPTVILFKDGQPVEQVVGNQPKNALKGLIDKHLA